MLESKQVLLGLHSARIKQIISVAYLKAATIAGNAIIVAFVSFPPNAPPRTI